MKMYCWQLLNIFSYTPIDYLSLTMLKKHYLNKNKYLWVIRYISIKKYFRVQNEIILVYLFRNIFNFSFFISSFSLRHNLFLNIWSATRLINWSVQWWKGKFYPWFYLHPALANPHNTTTMFTQEIDNKKIWPKTHTYSNEPQ